MSTPPPPAPVNPAVASRGVVKTLGILNIVFGAILMLCCTLGDAYIVALPHLMPVLEQQQKMVQTRIQAQHDEEVKAIREQEEKAKTDEEKARLRAERIAAESQPVQQIQTATVDLKSFGLDDPRVQGHYAVEGVTCLIVNLLMIVSGIGLLRLKSWGRRMAIWVAILKIARLVLLAASYQFIVQPATSAKMAQAVAGNQKVEQMEAVKSLQAFAPIVTILYLGAGVTYPIVVLILLTRPGAKAAVSRNQGVGRFDV